LLSYCEIVNFEMGFFIDNKVENLQAALDLGFGRVVLFPKGNYEGTDFPAIDSLTELKNIF